MRSALAVLPLIASSHGFAPSLAPQQRRHGKHRERRDARRAAPPTAPPGPARGGGTALRSVPTSLDTLTSGLASIARLPRGVSVGGGISLTGPAASLLGLPSIRTLYDVENDRDCRRVRERITELDLVVERVVPAAEGSRAREADPGVRAPTMAVADADGVESTLVGADAIVAFLDDRFSKEINKRAGANDGEEGGGGGAWWTGPASYLPGILRAGRGSRVCAAASEALRPPRPGRPLVLYSYEGNQFCRLVREALTELDVAYELRSAGKGSSRREELADITGGSSQCPYLIDPNTGTRMAESKDIVEYLYEQYALWIPPSDLLRGASGAVMPLLAPLWKEVAPLQAGSNRENEFEYASDIAEARADIYDEIADDPVVIYTIEYSPFSTEAVKVLKSAGTDFKEISLGRSAFPGLLEAPEKRAALLEMTGQSSLPHIFVGGTSVGGLFSGRPGLVPLLEQGEWKEMVEDAKRSM